MINIVEDDNVRYHSGDTGATIETDTSVVKYFFFSATSISESSSTLELEYTDEVPWDVDACVVLCVCDASNELFAIRVTMKKFESATSEPEERLVHVHGVIYTDSSSINAPFDISLRMTECPASDVFEFSYVTTEDVSTFDFNVINIFNRNEEYFSAATDPSNIDIEWTYYSGSGSSSSTGFVGVEIPSVRRNSTDGHMSHVVARMTWDEKDSDYDTYKEYDGYVAQKHFQCEDGPVHNTRITQAEETVFIPSGFFNGVLTRLEYTHTYDNHTYEGTFSFDEPLEVIGYHSFLFGKHYDCTSVLPSPEDDPYIAYKNAFNEIKTIPGTQYTSRDNKLLKEKGNTSNNEITYIFEIANKVRIVRTGNYLRVIGNEAFKDLGSLERVELGYSPLEKIGMFAFEGTTSLAGFSMPNTVRLIGEGAFKRSGLESISIPRELEYIEDETFRNCKSLSNVDFSRAEKLKKILPCAFHGCESLSILEFPHSLERIERFAFKNCYSLSYVVFNDGLKYIGKCAFENCAIRDVTTSGGGTRIESYAFKGNNLEAIELGKGTVCLSHFASGVNIGFTIGKNCSFKKNACKDISISSILFLAESEADIPSYLSSGWYQYPHGIAKGNTEDSSSCNLYIEQGLYDILTNGQEKPVDSLLWWLTYHWFGSEKWGDVYVREPGSKEYKKK